MSKIWLSQSFYLLFPTILSEINADSGVNQLIALSSMETGQKSHKEKQFFMHSEWTFETFLMHNHCWDLKEKSFRI